MQVRIAEGVLMHEEEGEAFVLDPGSCRYFALNNTGVVVWRALEAGEDPVAALGRRWPDVAPDKLRDDAAALISRLADAGLVVDAGG